MPKYIIDATTGTVLDLDECFVVDTDNLSPEDLDLLEEPASDSELGDLARRNGKSVKQIGQDTGWGDNKYRYSVSYSPLSLKDEAESLLDGGIYEEEEPEYKRLEWVAKEATIEQLTEISDWIMWHDAPWDGYRDNVMEGIRAYEKATKEKN